MMPQIHGSLTDRDFVAAMLMAESKGKKLSEWVAMLVVEKIREAENGEIGVKEK